MPQFAPSETKTAIAPIVAKPSGMSCEAELFLGPNEVTKVATSGRIPFVSTGAAKNVSLPITMPSSPGTHHGYIDVFTGDLRFLAYILKEDVVIAAPSFQFGTPVVTISSDYLAPVFKVATVSCLITNPHAVSITHRLKCCFAYPETPSQLYCDRAWDGEVIEYVLTLAPGQSFQLVSPAHYKDKSGEDTSNPPLIGTGKKFYYCFSDEYGNRSALVLA